MSHLVLCENLVKIYKTADLEVVALQGLDLEVRRGEMLGIVGASGSGKSTLLNILGGLDRPSAGRVLVADQDLLKTSDATLDHYRRTQVGFVWQQPARNLIPYLPVWDNVQLPATLAGLTAKARRIRTEDLLKQVGLWEHRSHRLAELSGGQQQRVAIAVALANQPRLLLADEPTGEVDSATAQDIFDLLRELNQTHDLTTIVVTHDARIMRQVDRVIAIRDGKTSSETIRHRNQLQQAMAAVHQKEGVPPEDETVTYEEFVVLDATGRLQIPQAYRERFHIGDRVTLEATDDGVLIRPIAENRQKSSLDQPADPAHNSTPVPQRSAWQRLFRSRS